MRLKWTSKALSDLARLHAFLAPVNRSAAARVVQSLTIAAERLLSHPLIGAKLGATECEHDQRRADHRRQNQRRWSRQADQRR